MSDRSDPSVPVPLTPAQQGIWLGQAITGRPEIYNTAECLEIRGPLAIERFETALRLMVAECDALHQSFVCDEQGVSQQPVDASDWELTVLDISHSADPWGTVQQWADNDTARAKTIAQGELFTQALFCAGAEHFFWYQGIHHIAMDGYGFSLLARRLGEIYSALEQGQPVPRRFGVLADVVQAEASFYSQQRQDQDRAFWLQQLRHGPDIVSLSTKPTTISSTLWRQPLTISETCNQQIKQSCQHHKATWSEWLLAAVAGWLSLQSQRRELILGLPVMARNTSNALKTPGMMMNIVPLRLFISPEDTFADLVVKVKQQLKTIRPHQNYRHEQLKRELLQRCGQSRLFGPVVNIMPFDGQLSFGSLTAQSHKLAAGPVEDLAIGISARPDGTHLSITLDGNTDCYRAEQMAGFKESLQAQIRHFCQHPQQPITGVKPESDAFWQAALLNGKPLTTPAVPVLEQFQRMAHQRAGHTAVEYMGESVSYARLQQKVLALSARLTQSGVGPGDRVGLLLPRTPEAITALLAVLHAGAAWLPLDPTGPVARTRFMIDDASPSLLITTRPWAKRFVQSDWQPNADLLLLNECHCQPPCSLQPDSGLTAVHSELSDPAYIMYTSGSTGTPKGVVIDQAALAHFVASAGEVYGIRAADRVLQFAPLHFDTSVEEIFLTLCQGATLVIRPDAMTDSLTGFLRQCQQQAISVLDLPTAYWHELAYGIGQDGLRLPDSVHTVIIGGEAVLSERLQQWHQTVGDRVRLLNTYGPTETTIVATLAVLSGPDKISLSAPALPIGQPLPGLQALVLDEWQRPVPTGASGELYLLGATLAQGYLNQPKLTAQRFVSLTTRPSAPTAYRTGDRVRLSACGQLSYEGRLDHEFKISGHRVNPSDIENVLLQLAECRAAAVAGYVADNGIKRLAAWLVPEDPQNLSPDSGRLLTQTVRRALAERLPPALIPTQLRLLEQLPETPSGKVDRQQLLSQLPQNAKVPPPARMTAMEQKVLSVWQEVLGAITVDGTADFFQLGGQSLQMIQVANRLGQRLGQEVSVQTLFRYPALSELAAALTTAQVDTQLYDRVYPIRTTGTELPLFCIHPARGVAWDYARLLPSLPAQIPVYGLQAPGLDGSKRPDFGTGAKVLARMAKYYLAQIRRLQSQGPYRLLGWSSGGQLAHEIAVQMQEQDDEVQLLGLLDAYPASAWRAVPLDQQRALAGLMQLAGSKPRDTRLCKEDVYDLATNPDSLLYGVSHRAMTALIENYLLCCRMVRTSEHRRFVGNLLFFTARHSVAEHGFSYSSWQPYVQGKLVNHNIPCSHYHLLKSDHASAIGKVLSQSLSRALLKENTAP